MIPGRPGESGIRAARAQGGPVALVAAGLLLPLLQGRCDVPPPSEVLGFEVGTDGRLADYDRIRSYLELVCQRSPRARLLDGGRTTDGRPILGAAVSAPETIARLDRVLSARARLGDSRPLSAAERRAFTDEGKVIVLVNASIHPDEVGPSQATLAILHRLADSNAPFILRILQEVIVVIVPSQNPDGLDRVVHWYERLRQTPFARSPFPGLYHRYAGRDLNRDWLLLTQAETRTHIQEIQGPYRPEIVLDLHQMGSRGPRLFVPPYQAPVDPRVDRLLVYRTRDLGKHVQASLTARPRPGVITGALYDAWAPSRAYPYYHGGIRFLIEAASADGPHPIEIGPEEIRAPGPGRNHPDPWEGGTWHLRDIVEYLEDAVLSALDHAALDRRRWIEGFLEVRERALEHPPLTYVLPPVDDDPESVWELLEALAAGEVGAEVLQDPLSVEGTLFPPARPPSTGKFPVPGGSFLIRANQPFFAFARTLFERGAYPDLKPGHRPYDTTSHNLPLLFGIPYIEVRRTLRGASWGDRGEIHPRIKPARFGYFVPGRSTGSLALAFELLRGGFRVYRTLAGETPSPRCSPGGFIVAGPEAARPRLEAFSRRTGIEPVPLDDPPDCRTARIFVPRVALYESWVPCPDSGWTRWVLERHGIQPSILHDADVRNGNLGERWDVLILPYQQPGRIRHGHPAGRVPPEYAGGLGETGAEAVVRFVRGGGTAIALGAASTFLSQILGLGAVEPSRSPFVPGAVLRATVDPFHPLGLGSPADIAVFFRGGPLLRSGAGMEVIRYGGCEKTPLLLDGWAVGEERLSGTPALLEVPSGPGRAILFGFRPQFRGMTRGTFRFLLAAILHARSRPEPLPGRE